MGDRFELWIMSLNVNVSSRIRVPHGIPVQIGNTLSHLQMKAKVPVIPNAPYIGCGVSYSDGPK